VWQTVGTNSEGSQKVGKSKAVKSLHSTTWEELLNIIQRGVRKSGETTGAIPAEGIRGFSVQCSYPLKGKEGSRQPFLIIPPANNFEEKSCYCDSSKNQTSTWLGTKTARAHQGIRKQAERLTSVVNEILKSGLAIRRA